MYPPAGVYSDSYSKDMSVVRTKLQWALLIGLFILLLALPHFISDYLTTFVTNMVIMIIAVQGINLLTGYCGQITLGQAAFMMVGGFTSAILTQRLGLSFWIALPCAALVTVAIGLFFALPSVRVKGLYLALSTLAAQFIIVWVVLLIPQLHAAQGFAAPPPRLWSIVIDSAQEFYYLTIIIGALMIFFAKSIVRTALGRAFIAIRDNDLAAEAAGINIFHYKMIAFGICSFYAGIAGSLFAHYLGWIGTESFTLMDSIWYVGMAIVGGLGSVVGPIFGVLLIAFLRQGVILGGTMLEAVLPLSASGMSSSLSIIAFGLVLVVVLIWEPRGLAHRWEIFKSSMRLWPFNYWWG